MGFLVVLGVIGACLGALVGALSGGDYTVTGWIGAIALPLLRVAWVAQGRQAAKAFLENFGKEKGYDFDFIEQSSGGTGYGVDTKQERLVLYVGKQPLDVAWGDVISAEYAAGNDASVLKFTLRDMQRPKVELHFGGKGAEVSFARLQAAGMIAV